MGQRSFQAKVDRALRGLERQIRSLERGVSKEVERVFLRGPASASPSSRRAVFAYVGSDLNGEVAEIPLREPLRTDVRQGVVLLVEHPTEEREQAVVVSEDTKAGAEAIPIETERVVARRGGYIDLDPAQLLGYLWVEPGKVELGVKRALTGDAIAVLDTDHNAGTYGFLLVAALDEAIEGGAKIEVFSAHTKASVTAEVAAGGAAQGATQIDLAAPVVFDEDFHEGSAVRLRQEYFSSKLLLLDGYAALSVQYNEVAGKFELFAGPGGSKMQLTADSIFVDGNTTFADGYDPNQTRAVIYAAVAPATREGGDDLRQGDLWRDSDDNNRPYVWTGAAWTDEYTLIDNATFVGGGGAVTIDASGITVDYSVVGVGGGTYFRLKNPSGADALSIWYTSGLGWSHITAHDGPLSVGAGDAVLYLDDGSGVFTPTPTIQAQANLVMASGKSATLNAVDVLGDAWFAGSVLFPNGGGSASPANGEFKLVWSRATQKLSVTDDTGNYPIN